MVAAKILGRRRARASVPALREAAEAGSDIYLRAAALRSVIEIEGVESLRGWLNDLSRDGPFNVRAIARQALNRT